MKYKCQICDREVDDFVALSHVKTEEYLMKLILKDHPEWHEKSPICLKCVTYYRKLVKEGEV